mmetsp:Transcript_14416/g.43606  ORF Transcript_14416/g.43606 Transcript_14416/m.43606 type:complete len:202 (-) Transcript_14416:1042-1647(-)
MQGPGGGSQHEGSHQRHHRVSQDHLHHLVQGRGSPVQHPVERPPQEGRQGQGPPSHCRRGWSVRAGGGGRHYAPRGAGHGRGVPRLLPRSCHSAAPGRPPHGGRAAGRGRRCAGGGGGRQPGVEPRVPVPPLHPAGRLHLRAPHHCCRLSDHPVTRPLRVCVSIGRGALLPASGGGGSGSAGGRPAVGRGAQWPAGCRGGH